MSKEKKSDIIKKCLLAGLPITGIGIGIGVFFASESGELPKKNPPQAPPTAIEDNYNLKAEKIKVSLEFDKNDFDLTPLMSGLTAAGKEKIDAFCTNPDMTNNIFNRNIELDIVFKDANKSDKRKMAKIVYTFLKPHTMILSGIVINPPQVVRNMLCAQLNKDFNFD